MDSDELIGTRLYMTDLMTETSGRLKCPIGQSVDPTPSHDFELLHFTGTV